jgi:phage terminase large subunit GpA-like protein
VPADYLDQLLSMTRARDEKSRRYRYVVKKGQRNEVADAETYAYAALLLGPVDRSMLASEVDRVNREGAKRRAAQTDPLTDATPAPTPPSPRRSGSTWLNSGSRPRGGWLR